MIKHNERKNYETKSFGFTLIELLVGLTIIGSLFGYGFVSYRDFTRRQTLSSLGKQIQGDIRLAQANAISGFKPTVGACDSTYVLDNYSFNVLSPTEYEVFATCSKVGSQSTIQTKDVELPAGITIAPTSVNPITFKVLGQGNNIQSGSSATIVLTQAGTNTTYTVTITSGGEVK